LTIWILLRYSEHYQIANMTVSPSDYADEKEFSSAYRATGLLSKFPDLVSEFLDPRKTAIESFKLAEDQCARTNATYPSLLTGPALWVNHEARKIVYAVLGSSPFTSSWRKETFDEGCIWGPGSTSSSKGRFVSLADKFLAKPELTASLNHLVPVDKLLNLSFRWKEQHCSHIDNSDSNIVTPTIVGGNKVTFVRKNAKTDRSIAVEPHLNALVQHGCGKLIRKLLQRHGLDLNSNSRNIELAKKGSLDGSYSTLDLKAASDTIATSVVRDLLPPDWFSLLDACRSKRYKSVEGGEDWLFYHKFSSMGNGFTFELESLIFWAIARASCRYHHVDEDVAVFGDDIVCPELVSDTVISSLGQHGFTLNTEKSFTVGPFRESCGGDFFLGHPVTRFQLKDSLSPRELVVLHNKATTASLLPFGRDKTFEFFIRSIRSNPVVSSYSLGPYGHDGCLWSDFDEAHPRLSKKKTRQYQRPYYVVRRETFKPRMQPADSHLDVTAWLYRKPEVEHPTFLQGRGCLIEDILCTSNPWVIPITVSSGAGRPQRLCGLWSFREFSVTDFPFLGGFI
jgi:hypothetical protein